MDKKITGVYLILLSLFFSCHKKEDKSSLDPTESWIVDGATKLKKAWGSGFGGSLNDEAINHRTVTRLLNGSYIIAASTASNNEDAAGSHGGKDFFIIKLDASGNKIWSKVYGGSGEDIPASVMYMDDYSLIVTGSTTSTDGDVTNNHGKKDAWVLKLDVFDGKMIWQTTLGGPGNDEAVDAAPSQLFSLFVVGTSEGGFVSSVNQNYGLQDVWIINISDISGQLSWSKFFGGSQSDVCTGLTHNSLGYVLTGYTSSNDGDVRSNQGSKDAWVLIFDALGKIISSQTIGGTKDDIPQSIGSIRDGTVITGTTASNDGDMKGNHGKNDVFVAKFGPSTKKEWVKTFGGSGEEEGNSVAVTLDGDFIICGKTGSNDGDINMSHGSGDGWVFKLGNVGNRYWQRVVGGSKSDCINSIYVGRYEDHILVGTSNSTDGDITHNRGNNDIFVLNFK